MLKIGDKIYCPAEKGWTHELPGNYTATIKFAE